MIVLWRRGEYFGEPLLHPSCCVSKSKGDHLGSAKDFRHGVEKKQWPAQDRQAKLYFKRTQEALDTVKVVITTPPTSADTDDLGHRTS